MKTRDPMASTHHRQFVGGESLRKVEEFSDPHTKHYWISHKKVSVDLMEDAPFALERQLEDQRFQISGNRNPQLHIPTKADKSRSQQMIIKRGATRNIAMKARVLNKIIREESGHRTYTLMPPITVKGSKRENEPVDPETHPLFRPYALEAHAKPTIQSFGHRPGSASRTFNPATMKIRLRHGAVAKQEKPQQACGFGIPVAVLTKVLKAPDLPRPGDEIPPRPGDEIPPPTGTGMAGSSSGMFSDPNNLFPTTEEMTSMGMHATDTMANARKSSSAPHIRMTYPDSPTRSVTAGGCGYSPGSPGNQSRQTVLSGISQATRRKPPDADTAKWNDGFQVIHEKANDKYKLRCSGIELKSNLTLTERLNRYAKMTVAQAQITPWCPEKQLNDRLVLQTCKPVPTKASSHVLGDEYEAYQDKTKDRIDRLQRNRNAGNLRQAEKWSTKLFAQRAQGIPDVHYNPLTALQLMKSAGREALFQHAVETGLPDVYTVTDLGRKHDAEKDFVMALGAARQGDKRALFDYYMRRGVDENAPNGGGADAGAGGAPLWRTSAGVSGADSGSPTDFEGYHGGSGGNNYPEGPSSDIASPQWLNSHSNSNSSQAGYIPAGGADADIETRAEEGAGLGLAAVAGARSQHLQGGEAY